MNQKELATVVDLTPAAMCRIEKGQATPKISNMVRICDGLQCSLSQLIYPVEPELRDDRLSAMLRGASKGSANAA